MELLRNIFRLIVYNDKMRYAAKSGLKQDVSDTHNDFSRMLSENSIKNCQLQLSQKNGGNV